MRNTLLTTTALVLTAGIASADGHATISWSGSATAGVARDGAVQSKAAGKASATSATADAAMRADADDTIGGTPATTTTTNTNSVTTALLYQARILDEADATMEAVAGLSITATHTGTTAAAIAVDVAALRTEMGTDRSGAVTAMAAYGGKATVLGAPQNTIIAAIDNATALLDNTFGTAAVAEGKAGKFKTYSEVNATVTGAVALDNGMSVSASMSVDAGTGYDFADDDSFDSAKTNGVSLDSITLNAGAMGTLKLDENAVAHLVDGDDDAAADLLYTNTLGTMSVSVAMDVSEDGDATAKKASSTVLYTAGVDSSTSAKDASGFTTATVVKAVAADVQWSAKISMPLAGGSAYVAMDEEGGNIFGASTTLGGIGLTFSSKLEALEEELSIDRDNSLGATYVMGATTLGATWNSVEDKDQWGISAAYSADGMTINASTDEGSDWSVSGSYLMGTGASVVGGVNYTEDAYLGLSFSF